ncbi:MAG: uracil-DNA glycosylase [Tepidisphaeraceae bacterium]
MAESARAKSRAKLILKAERAFGAGGVIGAVDALSVGPTAPVEPAQLGAVPANARRAIADSLRTPPRAVAKPVQVTPAAPAPAQAGDVLSGFGPNRPPFESAPHPREKKIELLQALDVNEVKGCTKCILHKTRTQTVFGEGDADAPLMFIGEGPGENEDLTGRPFVGKAGQLLDKMIVAMGLSRQKVFIANIVKCRPPNNRVPAPDEVSCCTPYLERQIELIRPRVIVTLGLPATQYMLQSKNSMSRMRGLWHAWRGIKLMPTYHPAYVLRQYTEQTRKAVWSDLQQVMVELGLKIT